MTDHRSSSAQPGTSSGRAVTGDGENGIVESEFAMSPMQLGMVFQTAAAGQRSAYVEQVICTLAAGVDIQSFERAWQRLIARHEALRTTFDWTRTGEPVQRVFAAVACPFVFHDWRSLEEREVETWRDRFLEADRLKGFDVRRAPLFRLNIVQLPGDRRLFAWTHHHAILDGRARVRVLKELGELYACERCGGEPTIATRSSFKEYVEWYWKQQWSSAERYWRNRLRDPVLSLPLTGQRGATDRAMEGRFATVPLQHLPDEQSVRALADRNGFTTSSLIQAVWAIVLARYGGDDDVVFGTVRACRRNGPPECHDVVGVRANTVPVRIRVNPQKSVIDYVKEVRRQLIALRAGESAPLWLIREWSRGAANGALFDTLVVLEKQSLASVLASDSKHGWQTTIARVGYTHYSVVLKGYLDPLSLQIDYDLQRFDAAFIAGLVGHVERLLEQVVMHPAMRIGELDLLTAAERRRVVAEWNETVGAEAPAQGVHECVERQVAVRPDAIAVVGAGTALTYDALNRRANQLARLVRARCGPEGRVVILCERSFDMVVAVLGVLKAGAAYVPLDPTYPDGRLQFMLRDAAPQLLLTQSRLSPRFDATPLPIVCLDDASDQIGGHDDTNPRFDVGADDLLYIIYTSGSTGVPKGIGLPHRAMGNLLAWYWATRTAGVRTLQYASLSFDLASLEMLSSLGSGGTVVLVDHGLRQDMSALANFITAQAIDTLMLPVSVSDHLARELSRCSDSSHVREIVTAGEQLQVTPSLVECATRTGCALHNFYGPSETHVVTAHRLAGAPATWPARPPIGRPIANTTIDILDGCGQPAPVGVPGEVYIGGVGLAQGYWRRPALTAARFVADPFSRRPGARVYRTGDMARWQADGTIEFLGRRDDQVKIRGYRVEVGEVEAVLAHCPGVDQAVVLMRGDSAQEQRLAAYVVRTVGNSVTAGEVRGYLNQHLPEYMVPSWIVLLERMPLTANGKVDRRALPAPGDAVAELASEYVAPRTVTEELLAGLWADVLAVERVGVHDNFFDLGGHSILAMQLVNRASECFLRPISIRVLFEVPTVAGLRQYLVGHERFAGETERIAEAAIQGMRE